MIGRNEYSVKTFTVFDQINQIEWSIMELRLLEPTVLNFRENVTKDSEYKSIGEMGDISQGTYVGIENKKKRRQ